MTRNAEQHGGKFLCAHRRVLQGEVLAVKLLDMKKHFAAGSHKASELWSTALAVHDNHKVAVTAWYSLKK